MMKICKKCKITKPVEDFNKNRRYEDGINLYCRICMRAYQDAHYYGNHATEVQKRLSRKKRIKDAFQELKAQLFCGECGEDHPATLDFHHIDPSAKEFSIGRASHDGWSMARLKAEIAKCVVLCSNCHRKHHWQERKLAPKEGLEPSTRSFGDSRSNP